MLTKTGTPVAHGPLVDWHRHAGGRIENIDGWDVCASYPHDEVSSENVLVDWSHRRVREINGPRTEDLVRQVCGEELAVRRAHAVDGFRICRLTPDRAIVFGEVTGDRLDDPNVLDVTGGWATVALAGPGSQEILSKITSADLRDDSFSPGECCQVPIRGVNTLLCRWNDCWELHACPDSLRFLWDVLQDAGEEFSLRLVGHDWLVEQGFYETRKRKE